MCPPEASVASRRNPADASPFAWPSEMEPNMLRLVWTLATVAVLASACGTTRVEKTVVVTPSAGSTVVVPDHGKAQVVPPSTN